MIANLIHDFSIRNGLSVLLSFLSPLLDSIVLHDQLSSLRIYSQALSPQPPFVVGKKTLVVVSCNSQKLQNVSLSQIIEHQSHDFVLTFSVHFGLDCSFEPPAKRRRKP